MHRREDNIYFAKVFGGAVVLIALLILIFFLTGCTTSKKVTTFTFAKKNKEFSHQLAQKVFNASDSLSANYCFLHYPCPDSVSKEIKYIPGVPVHDTEFIAYDCDSAIKAAKGKVVKIPIYITSRVDTEKIVSHYFQTDKAELRDAQYKCNELLTKKDAQFSAIQGQLTKSKQQADSAVKSAKKWRVWAIYTSISLLLLVLTIGVHIYLKNKL